MSAERFHVVLSHFNENNNNKSLKRFFFLKMPTILSFCDKLFNITCIKHTPHDLDFIVNWRSLGNDLAIGILMHNTISECIVFNKDYIYLITVITLPQLKYSPVSYLQWIKKNMNAFLTPSIHIIE